MEHYFGTGPVPAASLVFFILVPNGPNAWSSAFYQLKNVSLLRDVEK
jgi:hypothetical protein